MRELEGGVAGGDSTPQIRRVVDQRRRDMGEVAEKGEEERRRKLDMCTFRITIAVGRGGEEMMRAVMVL